jgi:hypothetical protein
MNKKKDRRPLATSAQVKLEADATRKSVDSNSTTALVLKPDESGWHSYSTGSVIRVGVRVPPKAEYEYDGHFPIY